MGGKPATKRDKQIGARIRKAREDQGLSPASLGLILKQTYQSVLRYESGTARIAASTLEDIAKALGKPVEWFYG